MAVVLLKHMVEIFIGADRDEGIKVFRKDLVLDYGLRVTEHSDDLLLQLWNIIVLVRDKCQETNAISLTFEKVIIYFV